MGGVSRPPTHGIPGAPGRGHLSSRFQMTQTRQRLSPAAGSRSQGGGGERNPCAGSWGCIRGRSPASPRACATWSPVWRLRDGGVPGGLVKPKPTSAHLRPLALPDLPRTVHSCQASCGQEAPAQPASLGECGLREWRANERACPFGHGNEMVRAASCRPRVLPVRPLPSSDCRCAGPAVAAWPLGSLSGALTPTPGHLCYSSLGCLLFMHTI